jgi:hypothetical protein
MRKYHRTMHQAFPFGAEYGSALYATKPSIFSRFVSWATYGALFVTLLALAMAYFDVLVP